jgi:hypothetical protein
MSRIEILWRWMVATCGGGLLCWLMVCCLTFAGAMLPFGSIDEMARELSSGLRPIWLIFWGLVTILLLFGFIVGAAQRKLLSRYFSKHWVKANVIAWGLALLSSITCLFLGFSGPIEAITLSTLIAAVILGTIQWRSLPIALHTLVSLLWWIFVNTCAIAVGALMVYWTVWVLILDNRIIFAILEPLFPLKAALLALAGLLPYSTITGFGLVAILGVDGAKPTK